MESRARGQGHKKIFEAKDSPFEDRPFPGQGHRRKCSPKKDSNNTVSKKFFHEKGLLKFVQVISKSKIKKSPKKTNFSTKNNLQNFKDSKHTAVLEPRTAILENLKL